MDVKSEGKGRMQANESCLAVSSSTAASLSVKYLPERSGDWRFFVASRPWLVMSTRRVIDNENTRHNRGTLQPRSHNTKT